LLFKILPSEAVLYCREVLSGTVRDIHLLCVLWKVASSYHSYGHSEKRVASLQLPLKCSVLAIHARDASCLRHWKKQKPRLRKRGIDTFGGNVINRSFGFQRAWRDRSGCRRFSRGCHRQCPTCLTVRALM